MKVRKSLRALLQGEEVLITTGAYDALSARIIAQAGFPLIISTGFGISASLIGKPDAELYTMTENLSVVRNMALAVQIPIIADMDTGYGNAVNVVRTVKEFERGGCAGGILEDQLFPKRCPACVEVFPLISKEEAMGKIRAALDAREDPDFLIVARTDAIGEEAVERAKAYLEAGAEMILFISKAFSSFRELKTSIKDLKAPICINFFEGLNYPTWFNQEEWEIVDLKKAGVKIVNYPLIPVFSAAHAMQATANYLARHKTLRGLQEAPRMNHNQFMKLIGFPEVEALQAKYMPPH